MIAEVLLHAMAVMSITDGKVLVPEVQKIEAIYKKTIGKDLSKAAFEDQLKDAVEREESLQEYLIRVREGLSDHEKRVIVGAVYAVAVSDWELHDSERDQIAVAAEALGIDPDKMSDVRRTSED